MTPEERTEYASRILNNPLWDEVMTATKDDLYKQLESVDLTDHDRMQAIAACAQWRETIIAHLHRALTSEQVTRFNFKQREKVI